MSGKSLAHKIWNFPSYSTILTQTFSPDGNHLALGNDRGIIAIFSVNDLLSSGRNANANDSGASCSFFFRALSHSQDVKFANGDSVNVLVSTKTFLVAAVSVRATNSAKIVAWNWADLIGSQASNGSQVKHELMVISFAFSIILIVELMTSGSPEAILDHRILQWQCSVTSNRD